MVLRMTKKENDIYKCARMILQDQCPPDCKHYLCAKEEDDGTFDCLLCWDSYLRGVVAGMIELPKEERRAV